MYVFVFVNHVKEIFFWYGLSEIFCVVLCCFLSLNIFFEKFCDNTIILCDINQYCIKGSLTMNGAKKTIVEIDHLLTPKF